MKIDFLKSAFGWSGTVNTRCTRPWAIRVDGQMVRGVERRSVKGKVNRAIRTFSTKLAAQKWADENLSQHTHNPGDEHLYDNGCTLCDCQQHILAFANGTAEYPSWMDEDRKEAALRHDVDVLYRHHGIPTTDEMLKILPELVA